MWKKEVSNALLVTGLNSTREERKETGGFLMLFTLTASPLAERNVAEPSGDSIGNAGMPKVPGHGRETKRSLATETSCPLVFRMFLGNKWLFICKKLWPSEAHSLGIVSSALEG